MKQKRFEHIVFMNTVWSNYLL